MNVTKEVLENKKVKLTINVDNETFEKGMDQSYKKNRKHISIPGFRKGHVPRKVIETYYGESIFYEDAINAIFPDVYEKAVMETGIIPVEHPTIDIVQIGSGKELILTAEVAVKPDVELGQYKGLEVEKTVYKVTDEDVDRQMESIRQRNARWIAIEDRPVKEGDTIVFDYSGSIDGVPFEGGTAEKYSLEIGSGRFIPGFEDQMVGIAIGEEKEISVKFPDDYHSEELKGKDAVFKVKVHEIKEKELPELDDEFAKDVSEFDTLAEYKADIRANLEKGAREREKMELENAVVEKAVANATVDIPDAMIESQIDEIMQDVDFRLRYSGINLEKYLEMTNTSVSDFRAQYKDEAYNRVKTRLVLEKIIETENIEAAEEDIEAEYANIASRYNQDVETVKKNYADSTDYIKNMATGKKVLDFLVSEAIVTEKAETETEQKDDNTGEDGE